MDFQNETAIVLPTFIHFACADMTLDRAIQKFKDWASNDPTAGQNSEWEYYYPHWGQIYDAFANFVKQTDYRRWSLTETQNVLYIIARDNEAEFLIDEIAKQKECLFALAEAAINCDEPDAKWQIASRLGRIEDGVEDVEVYLLKFLNDDAEYVRRRALSALAQIGSTQTEAWAEIAWETGHEYQRMAALHALHQVSSSKLDEFIALAKEDGRRYLLKKAMDLST